MKRHIRGRHVRSTRAAMAVVLAGAMASTSLLVTAGSAGAASPAPPLSSSVHPPTFNDSALFGLRNALLAALKGHSMSGVDTWMVVNILATYWVAGQKGDARAAKELGIAAHYEGPSQGQLATQVSEYETLASTGATGYFSSVIDPVSEGNIINKAVAKGLDVVAIDSPVPTADANTFVYVGTPNVTAGEAAGAAMKKALPNGGDVAILTGSLTATNSLQRIQGFKEAIAGSKIKVVSTENDGGAAATAATDADTVISSDANLKGIYGVYSYDGPAASVAVKSKGDIGKIFVVADDNEPGTITGLENGSVAASIIQQPFMQGYIGAYLTAAMHVLGAGKVAAIMKPYLTSPATSTSTAVISTGVGTLTKANLAADLAYNSEIGAG
jgi:ribose transport system substrate-binding protein